MKKYFALVISVFLIVICSSCKLFMSFDELADQMFMAYLGEDLYAWNLLTVDSSAYGFEKKNDTKASWYKYQKLSSNDISDAYSSFSSMRKMLHSYNYDKLSDSQKITYNSLDLFFDYYCDFYNSDNNCDRLMDLSYIDSSGGYVANFGNVVDSYHFYNSDNVNDLIDYIISTKEAFASYVTYVDDRSEAGYPISNYTLNNMISYLDDVLDKGESYYLFELLDNKIKNSSVLDTEQKSNFRSVGKQALKDNFIVGVRELRDNLASRTGSDDIKNEGYLGKYANGKNQYEISLENLLGFYDLNMDEYINYLDDKISQYSEEIKKINDEYSDDLEYLEYQTKQRVITDLETPEEMLEYLKTFAKSIVPDLGVTPNINISYMDETVASISNTVAYYTKSALDNIENEHITLNSHYLESDYTETLITLSHEGYPGHLYDYTYAKQLDISNFAKVNTCLGRAEGWAVYVELKLYEELKANLSSSAAKAYCDYEYYNVLLGYLLYTRIDVLINFEGKNIDGLVKYLDDYGLNTSNANKWYRTLIEIPTTYASYGFGSSYMLDLHLLTKEALGSNYNEIDYNTAILSKGWSGLDYLTDVTYDYIIEHGGTINNNDNSSTVLSFGI